MEKGGPLSIPAPSQKSLPPSQAPALPAPPRPPRPPHPIPELFPAAGAAGAPVEPGVPMIQHFPPLSRRESIPGSAAGGCGSRTRHSPLAAGARRFPAPHPNPGAFSRWIFPAQDVLPEGKSTPPEGDREGARSWGSNRCSPRAFGPPEVALSPRGPRPGCAPRAPAPPPRDFVTRRDTEP